MRKEILSMSTGFETCIISKGRADRVKTLRLFPDAYITVPRTDVEDYEKAGHKKLIVHDRLYCAGARNASLDALVDKTDLLVVDDDITEIGLFKNSKEKIVYTDSDDVSNLISKLFDSMHKMGAITFGVAPTDNAYYFSQDKLISKNLFILGSFVGYAKGITLRYDESLILKEDYDYTVKVWMQTGIALRFNQVYTNAEHYDNEGGCKEYRTWDLEDEVAAILMKRYPKYVKPHPRREHEVLLRLK